jgi:hypothetical protein
VHERKKTTKKQIAVQGKEFVGSLEINQDRSSNSVQKAEFVGEPWLSIS